MAKKITRKYTYNVTLKPMLSDKFNIDLVAESDEKLNALIKERYKFHDHISTNSKEIFIQA